MQKSTMVLTAALGTTGALGIAVVLFCIGVYAEGIQGRSWRTWTSADDREER